MADFLEGEIELEKKASRAAPTIKGFDVKTDGADVTLSKASESET